MMQSWRNLFLVLLIILALGAVGFDAMLFKLNQDLKVQMQAMNDKQTVEYEFNSGKFKYEEDQIHTLKEDLADLRSEIKGQEDDLSTQKDTLLQEAQKRQALEDEDKNILTSLNGIQASAIAAREDMKTWQKDYVTVLAQLGDKMDNTQAQIKSMDDNLAALNLPELKTDVNNLQADIEKLNSPTVNSTSTDPSDPQPKIEHSQMSSQ